MLGHSYLFEAFGTQWSIETDKEIPQKLKEAIQSSVNAFDKVYSRFRKDSLVTEISKKAGIYTFPADAKKLFDFYKQLYDITNGKVTPLIGDMISRAGYDAMYSLQPQIQEPILSWNNAMKWNGVSLQTSEPIMLDIGAAGKGYMVDNIATILDDNSMNEYVIDASGDLRHKGVSENKVGLEHPLYETKVIGVVNVQNKSLCASSSNRRAWGEGMHHIFDPDEMAPTNDIIATWVIANETMVADGLATALFFTEPKKLRKMYDFEFVRMHINGSVEYSRYFENGLFLN